jgi:hypothetical protein
MSKQLEGLCPHGRHTGAVCIDCGLEADLYQPNKQVDWKSLDEIEVDEIVGGNAYIDGVLQPERDGATYGVGIMEHPDIVKEQEDWCQPVVIKPVAAQSLLKEDITAQSILQEAIDCISDRAPFRDANGEKSIELAAEVFSKLTGHDLTEYDACIFLACIKLARSQRGEFTRDDYVDAASYIGLAGESRERCVRPAGKRPEQSEVGEDMPPHWIP